MLEVYINANQLFNFLFLKEPVVLITNPFDDKYFKFYFKLKDVHIEVYKTYSTIELLTFRKKVRLWMRKFKKKK